MIAVKPSEIIDLLRRVEGASKAASHLSHYGGVDFELRLRLYMSDRIEEDRLVELLNLDRDGYEYIHAPRETSILLRDLDDMGKLLELVVSKAEELDLQTLSASLNSFFKIDWESADGYESSVRGRVEGGKIVVERVTLWDTHLDPVEVFTGRRSSPLLPAIARLVDGNADDLELLARFPVLPFLAEELLRMNLPFEAYVELARSPSQDVRLAVAENPNTPREVLSTLSSDKDSVIRSPVAGNPSAPAEVLRKLAYDESWLVRWEVAGNPKTPADILARLAEDEDWRVRKAVASNPNAPPKALRRLADDDWDVRRAVASNPNAPEDVLAKLAFDPDEEVRLPALRNPNCPGEVYARLMVE